MLQDTFKVTGNLILRRYDENGIINLEREHKNLVVTMGKQLIISRLAADTTPEITLTGVSGNGTTATITYATRLVTPYEIGSYITLSGVTPTTFNGTYKVNTASTTAITFDSAVNATASVAGKINSLSNSTIKTVRIGQSSTVTDLSDTALKSDLAGAAVISSKPDVADTTSNVTYTSLFAAGVGTSVDGITEAGLFNDDSKMMCRTVFPLITKSALESLEIFWTVTIN